MQTLVHEMVHAWQQHFGKPSRRSYHNKEWSDLMESIGLMPSDTGKEGGKRVGQKMADYVIEGGRFLNSFESLRSKAFNLTWRDRYPVREQIQQLHNGAIEALTPEAMAEAGIVVALPKSIPTREKFMCPKCAASAWGKPSLNLVCGDCSTAFKKV